MNTIMAVHRFSYRLAKDTDTVKGHCDFEKIAEVKILVPNRQIMNVDSGFKLLIKNQDFQLLFQFFMLKLQNLLD